MCIYETLEWIRDAKCYLENFSDPILSDGDTCDYFRQKVRRKKIVETPPPPKKEVLPPPVVLTPEPPPPPKIEAPVIAVKEEAPPKKRECTNTLRTLFAKIAPECVILDEIPSDLVAKKIANRWKTKNQIAPITFLSYQEQADHRLLLEQIVKALDVYFGPAALISADPIEEAKDWKTFLSAAELKLVIICDHTLWQLQHLRHFYKETPAQNMRLLGDKPLLMLPDLSLYLKDPLLKRSLWKALCQMISSLPSHSTKN
jgi:hypothetical protein